MTRLTDEDVWLRCFCAEVSHLDTVGPLAGELADYGLHEFRKRFPAEPVHVVESELVVEWVDGKNYSRANCEYYALRVYKNSSDKWDWALHSLTREGSVVDNDYDCCDIESAKYAAEAALRKELER
jgi:hypothetical protein